MAVRNANILAARGLLSLLASVSITDTNSMQLLPMLSERYCSFYHPAEMFDF